MSRDPSVFITYCREDRQKHESLMLKIQEDLKKAIPNLKIYYDKRMKAELTKVSEYEAKIRSVDMVLVMCTNAYKEVIISNDTNRHAYREYEYVLDVLELSPKRICPIIIDGDEKNVPEKLSDLNGEFLANIRDKSREREQKNRGKIIISEKKKQQYDDAIENISSKIQNNYEMYLCTRQPDETLQNIFAKLFCIRESRGTLPKDCMLIPQAYNDMFNTHKLFIVGRKGSGKTTFLEMLKEYDADKFNRIYKSLEIIKYDNLPIEQIYECWCLCEKDKNVYSQEKFLQLFIEIYVFLYSICVVGFELEAGKLGSDPRKQSFENLAVKLRDALKITSFLTHRDFLFSSIGATAIDILRQYIVLIPKSELAGSIPLYTDISNTIFQHASEMAYTGSMTIHLTWRDALNAFFNVDNNGKIDVQRYINALNDCTRRILFALDGFDNLSDAFRLITNQKLESNNLSERTEGQKRQVFLRMFDAYLVITLDSFKSTEKLHFSKNIDICVIFPRDRYEVFRNLVRDISKTSILHLDWDAFELMEMTTLRLEFFLKKLINESDDYQEIKLLLSSDVDIHKLTICKENDVWIRFEHAVSQLMPKIPMQISLDNGREISLFNYLLSLSMWRPRDILHYVEMLFTISRNSAKTRVSEQDMNETIREGMTGTSVKILDAEFIQEYQAVFYNIKDVLTHLRGANVLCSGIDIRDRLKNKFLTAITFDDGTFSGKLRTLFELGVIGFNVNEETVENYKLLDSYCYIFCHGKMTHVDVEFNERLDLVINPMFKTRLMLKMNLNNEIIGDYSKERINLLHRIKQTLPEW